MARVRGGVNADRSTCGAYWRSHNGRTFGEGSGGPCQRANLRARRLRQPVYTALALQARADILLALGRFLDAIPLLTEARAELRRPGKDGANKLAGPAAIRARLVTRAMAS